MWFLYNKQVTIDRNGRTVYLGPDNEQHQQRLPAGDDSSLDVGSTLYVGGTANRRQLPWSLYSRLRVGPAAGRRRRRGASTAVGGTANARRQRRLYGDARRVFSGVVRPWRKLSRSLGRSPVRLCAHLLQGNSMSERSAVYNTVQYMRRKLNYIFMFIHQNW